MQFRGMGNARENTTVGYVFLFFLILVLFVYVSNLSFWYDVIQYVIRSSDVERDKRSVWFCEVFGISTNQYVNMSYGTTLFIYGTVHRS